MMAMAPTLYSTGSRRVDICLPPPSVACLLLYPPPPPPPPPPPFSRPTHLQRDGEMELKSTASSLQTYSQAQRGVPVVGVARGWPAKLLAPPNLPTEQHL